MGPRVHNFSFSNFSRFERRLFHRLLSNADQERPCPKALHQTWAAGSTGNKRARVSKGAPGETAPRPPSADVGPFVTASGAELRGGGGGTANTAFSDDPKYIFNVTEQKSAELQRPWPPFEINWGTVHVKM